MNLSAREQRILAILEDANDAGRGRMDSADWQARDLAQYRARLLLELRPGPWYASPWLMIALAMMLGAELATHRLPEAAITFALGVGNWIVGRHADSARRNRRR